MNHSELPSENPASSSAADRWIPLPAYGLIFLMSVFPLVPSLLNIKVMLLVVVIVSIVILTLATGRTGLHPTTAVWIYFMSALGFLFVLKGFVAGLTGAAQEIQIYVIWPVIYGLLLAGIRSDKVLFGLVGTILLATSCVGLYSIAYSLAAVHAIPNAGLLDFIIVDSERQLFASADGFIRMAYPGLNSLVFLVPFSFAALVTYNHRVWRGFRFRRFSLWAAVLLGPTSVLLSGRRALYLVTLAAPFFTLFFLSFQPKAEREANRRALLRVIALGMFVAVLSIACLQSVLGLNMAAVAKGFVTAFTFTPTTADKGAAYRREQFYALLSGWTEYPVFGSGYGAPASGSVRSQSDPYKYELTYMAMLYQTGLLGVIGYTAGICWIYGMGLRLIRRGGNLSAVMVASLVGLSSILVANATNPYFGSFERMWPIFVPIAVINYSLLRSSERKITSCAFV
jgi:hypothetical protein